jgi:hypothetical protein
MKGLYKGLVCTGVREEICTASYLGAAPMIKKKMEAMNINNWAAQIIAGTVAGTLAATISQPFDTVKTQMQADFLTKVPLRKALCNKGVYAGLGWRIAIIDTASIIIPYVQDQIKKRY